MSSVQVRNISYLEFKAKVGPIYYIDTGTLYILYVPDSICQIIFSTIVFYISPFTEQQLFDSNDFRTNILPTAIQVSNFDAVVSDTIWPTHEKVSSINADSNASLTGNVQLVSGSGITLSQTGQAITITASASAEGIVIAPPSL